MSSGAGISRRTVLRVGAVGVTAVSLGLWRLWPRTQGPPAAGLGAAPDIVLDGGPAPGGTPSTLVDLTRRPPTILRDGAVARAEIEAVLASGS